MGVILGSLLFAPLLVISKISNHPH